jgi:hypothetical protein
MGKCKGDSSSFVVVFLAAVCSFVQIAAFALKSVQDLGAVSAYVRMTMLSLQVARALKVNRHHVGWGQMTRRGGDKKILHFLGPSILCAATCGRRVGGALEAAGASFDAHQDTEEHDFIEYTAIVKLTPDKPGELPSEMRVVGAPFHFKYGPTPSASCFFRARLYHASVLPASAREHIKIAFFFKKAAKRKRPPQ